MTERPQKRRRLSSEITDDLPSDGDESQRGQQTAYHAGSVASDDEVHAIKFDTSSVSRIRSKKDGKVVANASEEKRENPNLPPSIQASIDSNDNSTFATLGVDPWLISSLSHMAIKWPTRIQKGCIPQIIAGRDCIGGSRTGSGKTAAFAVPILQQWARDPSGIFAVVLTPTRELALQLYEQIVAIGARQGIKAVLVTGGADMRTQALELAKRPHVVIATPGRLADHIKTSGTDTIRGLKKVKFVVLDEADRLLATGKGSMLPDVETCLSALPPSSNRQTCLFTATVTPEVRALKDSPRTPGKPPVFVCEVDTEDLAIPTTLKQTYQLVNVVHKEKYLHVLLLTPANAKKSIIIFCNRTSTATLVEYMLRKLDHRVTSLHSGLRHEERVSNLARFRARAARILVATDIAGRGLDIPDVGLVINYDLPRNPDDYIHRVGRTARAGKTGTSISLVGQRDVELVHAIEARVGREMEEYSEEGVNVETRVVRDALNVVGEKKREAMLAIEEGRDVKGKRVRRMAKMNV
ncbi:ATP-dependent RNA helicase DBP8 [Teratosphaeria destructans]|uniref:ATP-dependent RNA helicase DBP8 n=1 Tax=Teratosphaeria destructans TaxID=418781 RepID=A0A9W7SS14_9PEZI|nr:ATP-dependent RNA helicase DBP8 [Teratosphaeria destructans]